MTIWTVHGERDRDREQAREREIEKAREREEERETHTHREGMLCCSRSGLEYQLTSIITGHVVVSEHTATS